MPAQPKAKPERPKRPRCRVGALLLELDDAQKQTLRAITDEHQKRTGMKRWGMVDSIRDWLNKREERYRDYFQDLDEQNA